MSTKKGIATLLAALMVAGVAQAVTVTMGSVTQDAQTRRVTFTYRLDAPAIITADVRTNNGSGVYISIGSRNQRYMTGQVNKLVAATDTDVSFAWQPDVSWSYSGKVKAVIRAWSLDAPPTYMVFNLLDTDEVRYYVDEEALPYPITDDIYKTEKLVFRKIPAKGITWRMGAPEGAPGRQSNPTAKAHNVKLTADYYMGVYEYTIRQWLLTVSSDPSYGEFAKAADKRRACFGTSYNFLRGTSWPDSGHDVTANGPIDQLRDKFGIDVDLPTEAQWEYACRAGEGDGYYDGSAYGLENITNLAWVSQNSTSATAPVGMLKPNNWGLYDMLGNAYEVCLDWIDTTKDLSEYTCEDPPGVPSSGANTRAFRGGGYDMSYENCISSYRHPYWDSTADYQNIGFRLCAPAVAPNKSK